MKTATRFKTATARILTTLALVCLGALPGARAVVPPPDGGYPGGNTAEGQAALLSLTTGGFNTAVGFLSLRSDTTGQLNTAMGAGTLLANTADQNTATGAGSLLSNTIGTLNTANGALALFLNTTGSSDTATGGGALQNNTAGNFNVANGGFALFFNSTGSHNTAIGDIALYHNDTSSGNTAIGDSALFSNSGDDNTALGVSAGSNLTTGSDNIDIGNFGVAGDSSSIRIGNEFQTRTFIAAIRGVTTGVADAVNVVIDSNGQLGTMSSSRRFKAEIKPMDKTSEAILALKPVTFHYKSDKNGTPQFGLIAEEVAAANQNLVVHDRTGEIYTVRYDAVNAMLLNEFLKEHRKVQEQTQKIQEQETTIAELKKQVQTVVAHAKEQDIKIQRVSDRIQINSSLVVVTDR